MDIISKPKELPYMLISSFKNVQIQLKKRGLTIK